MKTDARARFDLTRIDGIGPSLRKRMAGRGVRNLDDLAEMPARALREAVRGAGSKRARRWRTVAILHRHLGIELDAAQELAPLHERRDEVWDRPLHETRAQLARTMLGEDVAASLLEELTDGSSAASALAEADVGDVVDLAFGPLDSLHRDDVMELQSAARIVIQCGADPALALGLVRGGIATDVPAVRAMTDVELAEASGRLRSEGVLPADYDFLPLPRRVFPAAARPAAPTAELVSASIEGASVLCCGEPGTLISLRSEEDPSREFGEAVADERGLAEISTGPLPPGEYGLVAVSRRKGEPLLSDGSSAVTFRVDRRAARVESIEPAPGSEAVPQDAAVSIRFDVPVDPEDLYLRSASGDLIETVRSHSEDGRVVKLTPVAVMPPNTEVHLLADAWPAPGDPVVESSLGRFTTGETIPFALEAVEAPEDLSLRDGLVGCLRRVVLVGDGFHAGLRVTVDGWQVHDTELRSRSEMHVDVLPLASGARSIVVTDVDGPVLASVAVAATPLEQPALLPWTRNSPEGSVRVSVFVPSGLERGDRLRLGAERYDASAVRQWEDGSMVDFQVEREVAARFDASQAGPEPQVAMLDREAGAVPIERLIAPPKGPAPAPPAPAPPPPRRRPPPIVKKCVLNPVANRTVEVGDRFRLDISGETDEPTLLTVSHHFGGAGAFNGGWSRRVDGPFSVQIPLVAGGVGLVSLEVKLWCPRRSITDIVWVRIRRRNRGGPPPPPPPPRPIPPPGGGGRGGPGGGGGPGGVLHTCTFVPGRGALAEYGDLLEGAFDGSGQPVQFVFGGRAGDVVALRERVAAVAAHFSLYGPGGLVESAWLGPDQVGRVLAGVPLPEDGRYTVVVCPDPLRNHGRMGRFQVDLERVTVQPIRGVNPGTVPAPGEAAVYHFTARANEYVDLSLDPPLPGFNPYFQLYDPEGRPVIDPDTLRQRIAYRALRLPADGRYTVRVGATPNFPGARTGGFTLRFRRTPVERLRPDPADVAAGAPLDVPFTGALGDPFDARLYAFERSDIARWYADVSLLGGPPALLPFRPRLQLIDPKGDVLYDGQSSFAVPDIPLKEDGLHHLRVFIQINDRGNGDYTSGAGAFDGKLGLASFAHLATLPIGGAGGGGGSGPSPGPGPWPAPVPFPVPGPLPGPPPGPVPVPGPAPVPGPTPPDPLPGWIPCDPHVALLGTRPEDGENVFFEGDEIVARAVPAHLVVPPGAPSLWSHPGHADAEYSWHLKVKTVDGTTVEAQVPDDLPLLGIEFVERDGNVLRLRVENADQILCARLKVQCHRFTEDVRATEESGGLPAGSLSNVLIAVDELTPAVEEGVEWAPCRGFAVWPDRDRLGVFELHPGIEPIPPRNVALADRLRGVMVHNGTFGEDAEEYRFENRGLPVIMGRTYYSMLDYPGSPMGRGWHFQYDVRLIRESGRNVRVLGATGTARDAEYARDPARSNRVVHVVEKTGEPGRPQLDRYPAIIDTFYTESEYSEVIAVHRFANRQVERVREGLHSVPRRRTPEAQEEEILPPDCETFYLLRFKDGTKYRFSCHGRLERIYDRNRNEMRFEYDDDSVPFGPTAVVQTGGMRHRLAYAEYGGAYRIETLESPDGKTTRFTYTSDGNLETVVSPQGPDHRGIERRATTRYGYQGDLLQTVTSPRRHPVVVNEYDGRRIRAQRFGSSRVRFSWADRTVTEARGVRIRYELTPDGAHVASQSILDSHNAPSSANATDSTPPHRRSYTYDRNGEVTRVEDEDGRIRTFSYETTNASTVIGPERWDPDPGVTYANNLAIGNRREEVETGPGGRRVASSFEFELQFNLIQKVTDPRGAITEHLYEHSGTRDGYAGSPTRVRHPKIVSYSGSSAPPDAEDRYHYDVYGLVTKVEKPGGRFTDIRRDANGYPFSTSESGIHTEVTERDKRGHIIRRTHPATGTTRYTQRLDGQPVREVDALGHETIYLYTASGLLEEERFRVVDDFTETPVSSSGAATRRVTRRYEYDSLDRVEREIEDYGGLGLTTRYRYDDDGRLAEKFTPRAEAGDDAAARAVFEYDERGLVRRIVRAPGTPQESVDEYAYDGAGHRTGHVAPSGARTIFEYDGLGRLHRTRLPNGTVVEHAFDDSGNLVEETTTGRAGLHFQGNPNVILRRRRTRFDEWSRPYAEEEEIFELSGGGSTTRRETRFEYDAAGELRKTVRPGRALEPAHEVTTDFDRAGRMTRREDNLGNSVTFVYNAAGGVETMTEVDKESNSSTTHTVVTTYRYDGLGRLTSKAKRGGGAHRTCYDSLGRVRLEIRPDGYRQERTYDAAGRLRGVGEFWDVRDIDTTADPAGAGTSFRYQRQAWVSRRYDRNGRVTRVYRPGHSVRYEYDSLDRMVASWEPASGRRSRRRISIEHASDGRTTTVHDAMGSRIVNYRDAMGSVIARQITRGRNVGGTTYEQYAYDGASRLTMAVDPDNDSYLGFTYDSGDNYRVEVQAIPRLRSTGPGGRRTYGLSHQVSLGASFDPRGYRSGLDVHHAGDGRSSFALSMSSVPASVAIPSAHRAHYYGRDAAGRVTTARVRDAQYEQTELSLAYRGPGSTLIEATLGHRGNLRGHFAYDEQRRLHRISYATGDGRTRFGARLSFTLDDVGRARSQILSDHRLTHRSTDPVVERRSRFEYDNRGQLIQEGLFDGQGTSPLGLTVSTYNRARQTSASVRIHKDPSLVWDYYLGDLLWKTKRYFRSQEEVTFRGDQIRQKDIEMAKVDVDPSLFTRLTGGVWESLPEDRVIFDYDRRGSVKRVRRRVPDKNDPDRRPMRNVVEYTYDYRGRLVETYDRRKAGEYARFGQPLSEPRARYGYDVFNRLIAVGVGALSSRGREILPEFRKTFTRRLVWDREHLVEELEDVGNAGLRGVRRYVVNPANSRLAAFERRSRSDAAADRAYAFFGVATDHVGRPLYLVDRWGDTVEAFEASTRGGWRVVSRARWAPGHGLVIDSGFRFENDGLPVAEQSFTRSQLRFPFEFGGHYHEPVSGMLYVRNRWYSPDLGTFVSRDQVNFSGPAYAYAGSDAAGSLDVDGNVPVLALMAFAGVIAGGLTWSNEPYGDVNWARVGLASALGAAAAGLTAGAGAALGIPAGTVGGFAFELVGGYVIGNALSYASVHAIGGESAMAAVLDEELGVGASLGTGTLITGAITRAARATSRASRASTPPVSTIATRAARLRAIRESIKAAIPEIDDLSGIWRMSWKELDDLGHTVSEVKGTLGMIRRMHDAGWEYVGAIVFNKSGHGIDLVFRKVGTGKNAGRWALGEAKHSKRMSALKKDTQGIRQGSLLFFFTRLSRAIHAGKDVAKAQSIIREMALGQVEYFGYFHRAGKLVQFNPKKFIIRGSMRKSSGNFDIIK